MVTLVIIEVVGNVLCDGGELVVVNWFVLLLFTLLISQSNSHKIFFIGLLGLLGSNLSLLFIELALGLLWHNRSQVLRGLRFVGKPYSTSTCDVVDDDDCWWLMFFFDKLSCVVNAGFAHFLK